MEGQQLQQNDNASGAARAEGQANQSGSNRSGSSTGSGTTTAQSNATSTGQQDVVVTTFVGEDGKTYIKKQGANGELISIKELESNVNTDDLDSASKPKPTPCGIECYEPGPWIIPHMIFAVCSVISVIGYIVSLIVLDEVIEIILLCVAIYFVGGLFCLRFGIIYPTEWQKAIIWPFFLSVMIIAIIVIVIVSNLCASCCGESAELWFRYLERRDHKKAVVYA